ncbi:DUF4124 domain-containing protein [Pseudomonas sp. 5P_3.1_Bac2]|uniref:DUF4124 domain-containing protein n=1 Tax=Pseudomonas sp. 5P_3.1_Bac2 TaxID=2971617 RepID=UPI0021C93271|nr:DUF4124 domain-containing protein [Pseudomonas sp. 5P_3.1_Bac2]MCU1718907.1 DUF4124 domain-containing protein [Pseudomonas sp. 5P_3.1_Bac2]
MALPVVAQAAELYRYIDDHGTTVLSRQGVPPEFISKGYQVLNDQGRVIHEVAPAPTAEELKKILAQKAQASSDEQLLRLYSSPEDVERARSRKLAELDGLLGVARGNLNSAASQQASLQAQAADQERAGRKVQAHLLDQIDSQKAEQVRLNADIARYQQAREEAERNFANDLERVRQLLGDAQ